MRIKSFITTYDRKQMLEQVVTHLNSKGIIPTIKDDGSDYTHDFPQYFRHKHRGKKKYWITWHEMFKDCQKSNAELYLFMPDDFQNLDVERMIALHYEYDKRGSYVYNIINDGRSKEWTGVEPLQVTEDTIRVGFTDCGFFCNRQALERLNFFIKPILDTRWLRYGENCSSGVGHQLSARFFKEGVTMYKPVKSLAEHGTHESKMHKEEREKNPLISK